MGWGKLIHEKNHKQKISWHCPFNKEIRYLGELVGSYDDLDVTDPQVEVPVVDREPVEEDALLQLLHQLLPAAYSCSQLLLAGHDLTVFALY